MAENITPAQKQVTAAVSVKISHNRLAAYVRIAADPMPETPLDPGVIHQALRKAGVIYGIDEQAVHEAAQYEKLNQDILVASGTPAEAGKNAQIEMKIDLESSRKPKVGEDGRIDYKNIDFLINAAVGTILAVKHPATSGTPGTGVDGKEISALQGKEAKLPLGNNTGVSPDGLQLLAKADGSIVYTGRRINIQPISIISGNISVETGNIEAIGSLRVNSDIESGYTVKVGGNLEVVGNVLDSRIEVTGNVLIKGGFIGQGNGSITAQGEVTVRYVENQSIKAGGDINVGGEALNAHLVSGNEICFTSARGKVVGGDIRARNLIRVRELGNGTGTTTIARVGYDSELMNELSGAKKEIDRLKSDLEKVRGGLVALRRLERAGKLPEAKKPVKVQLQHFQSSVPDQIKELRAKMAGLRKKIEENRKGKIAVEGVAYPGVVLYFGLTYSELTRREERRTYSVDYGKVVSSKFDPAKLKE